MLCCNHLRLGSPSTTFEQVQKATAGSQCGPEDGVATGVSLRFLSLRHTESKGWPGEGVSFVQCLENNTLQQPGVPAVHAREAVGLYGTLPGCGRTRDVLGTVWYCPCWSCTSYLSLVNILGGPATLPEFRHSVGVHWKQKHQDAKERRRHGKLSIRYRLSDILHGVFSRAAARVTWINNGSNTRIRA